MLIIMKKITILISMLLMALCWAYGQNHVPGYMPHTKRGELPPAWIKNKVTDAQYDYAMHSGTMLNAMQKIFLRFHHIPSEDLAKMVLANKKKSGLLHFEELEKMAQEIAEELLMDLMKFTMGV